MVETTHRIERRKDVRARIAEAVAKRWLEEAEAILAGGLTPVKLSKQHRMLVQEHADSIGVDLNTWEVRDIARSAVKEARYWILNSDRFPNVKQWVTRGLSQSLEDQYQAFVESMTPACRCEESNRPCEGVMAGGVCDTAP